MQSAIIALSEGMLESPDLNRLLAKDVREIRNIALQASELVHELMIHLGEDDLDVQPVNVPLDLPDVGGFDPDEGKVAVQMQLQVRTLGNRKFQEFT
jgi:hypothetical protein